MKLQPAATSELTLRTEPTGIGDALPETAATPADGPGFGTVLAETAMVASAKEREATEKAEALAQGRIDDLHGTMISMKEADISLKLVGSVRDRLLDAFHELWRINV